MRSRACQGLPQAFEPPANAIVDHLVAHARHYSADQGGVDARIDGHFVRVTSQVGSESSSYQPLHIVVQRNGGGDVGGDDATFGIDQVTQRIGDTWHLIESISLGQDLKKVADDWRRLWQEPVQCRLL